MNQNLLGVWANSHLKKIISEMREAGINLNIENIPSIIEENSYEVRSKKHPDECPYYHEPEIKGPCHPIDNLNCFLCACPEYKTDLIEGGCTLNSNHSNHLKSQGFFYEHPSLPKGKIWDCSDCSIPHYPAYVEAYLKGNIKKLKNLK